MNLQSARGCLIIARNRIDDELEVQSDMYFSVFEETAKARERKDIARVELDVARNMAIQVIRNDDSKIAETRVVRECESAPAVVKAKLEHIEATREYSLWDGMLEAYKQRSHALTALANLYAGQYFSKDSISVKATNRPNASDTRRERRRIPGITPE